MSVPLRGPFAPLLTVAVRAGTWRRSRLGSRDPDILATAFDYVAGAPVRTTAAGVKYSGAARYTPDTADDSGRAGQGKPKSPKPRTGSGLLRLPGRPLDLPRHGHPPSREGPRALRRQLWPCPAGVRIPLGVPAEQQGQPRAARGPTPLTRPASPFAGGSSHLAGVHPTIAGWPTEGRGFQAGGVTHGAPSAHPRADARNR